MEQGEGSGRGKRKLLTKRMVRRGRGSSSYVPRDRDDVIEEEERNQRTGFTISVWPDSPLHILEFDDSYMRDNYDEFVLREP
jgi:hypothetical protein